MTSATNAPHTLTHTELTQCDPVERSCDILVVVSTITSYAANRATHHTGDKMHTQPSASFGVLLRHYRQRAGLTQEALAEQARLTSNAISALERGDRRHPYPTTVRALAAALHLTVEQRDLLLHLARTKTEGLPTIPPT